MLAQQTDAAVIRTSGVLARPTATVRKGKDAAGGAGCGTRMTPILAPTKRTLVISEQYASMMAKYRKMVKFSNRAATF